MHLVKIGLGAPGAHPNPAYAHRPRALRPGRLCRGHVVGLCPAVSWLVVDLVAGMAPASRAPRAVSQASQAVSLILSRHTAVSQPLYRRPLSRYKLCIATQAPAARRVMRLPCVSQLSCAVSQGAGRRIAALATLCHDTTVAPLSHDTTIIS